MNDGLQTHAQFVAEILGWLLIIGLVGLGGLALWLVDRRRPHTSGRVGPSTFRPAGGSAAEAGESQGEGDEPASARRKISTGAWL